MNGVDPNSNNQKVADPKGYLVVEYEDALSARFFYFLSTRVGWVFDEVSRIEEP